MTTPDRRQVLLGASGAAATIALSPELLAAPPRLAAPVRLALIGAGRQGRAILGELAKFTDVTLAAVCDSDERRMRGAARRAPDATLEADAAKVLSDASIDAVILATPTHQLARIVARRGDAGGRLAALVAANCSSVKTQHQTCLWRGGAFRVLSAVRACACIWVRASAFGCVRACVFLEQGWGGLSPRHRSCHPSLLCACVLPIMML